MPHELHYQKHVFLCTNQKEDGKKCCAQSGGKPFFQHFKARVKALNLDGPGKIRISQSGCLGRCVLGPCLVIYPEGRWYTYHSLEDIDCIIEQDLLHGHAVTRLQIDDGQVV